MAYHYLPFIGALSKLELNRDAKPFMVKPGELTRWYIANAGPRKQVFFQLPTVPVSTQNSNYRIISTLPPLSTSIVEAVFPNEGVFVEMDADLGHFLKGSGFHVLSTPESNDDDHPPRSKILDLKSAGGEGHTSRLTLTAVRRRIAVVPDNHLLPGGLKDYDALVLVGSVGNRTLNDSIPGPVVGVKQGGTLEVSVVNETSQIISVIFAGLGPDTSTGSIGPGEIKAISIKCDTPGFFMYYGGADALNGIWEHVWNGMYGAIAVRPRENFKPAKEFCIILSELYTDRIKGLFMPAEELDR